MFSKPIRSLKLVFVLISFLVLFNSSVSYCNTTTVVGHYDASGYYVLNGPVFDKNISEDIWIDRNRKYLISIEGQDKTKIKFHDIVSYEIINLPGGTKAVYYILNRYPAVWVKDLDSCLVYGPKFW